MNNNLGIKNQDFKYQIIESIKNNTISTADFTNSSLNDNDCNLLAEALQNNTSLETLIINNTLRSKKIFKYNFQFLKDNYNIYKTFSKNDINLFIQNTFFNNFSEHEQN